MVSRGGLGERFLPGADGRRLAVFGGAVFEEIGVLDGIQHLVQPGQRIPRDVIKRVEAELGQAAVGDEADVLLHLARHQALHRAELEGEIDEGVLVVHDGGADDVDFAPQFLGPDLGIFLHEGAEQADDREAVQRLVAHRPGDDLAHALHFAEAREIQQDCEGREQLQPFGEGAEGRQRLGDLMLRIRR